MWTWPCRSVLFLSREWPEPSSSAAGVRSYALATAFAEWGWNVSYLRCSLDAPLGRGPLYVRGSACCTAIHSTIL